MACTGINIRIYTFKICSGIKTQRSQLHHQWLENNFFDLALIPACKILRVNHKIGVRRFFFFSLKLTFEELKQLDFDFLFHYATSVTKFH